MPNKLDEMAHSINKIETADKKKKDFPGNKSINCRFQDLFWGWNITHAFKYSPFVGVKVYVALGVSLI